MPKRKAGVTIYRRLLIIFFAAMLPFFALSLFSNRVAENRLLKQGENRMAQQLQAVVESCNELHDQAYSWMKVNLMDGYKMMLATQPNLSSFRLGQQTAALFEDLQHLSQLSDAIEDIAVYMPRTNRVISLNAYYQNAIPEDALTRIATYQANKASFQRQQGAFRTQSIFTTPANPIPLYVIEITFSDERMLKNVNSRGEEHYAILSGSETVVCAAEDRALLDDVSAMVISAADSVGQFIYEDTLISYGAFQDAEYFVSYIPMDVLLEPVRSFNVFSLITLGLAAILTLIITRYLDGTIKRPLKQLLMRFQAVEDGNMEVPMPPAASGKDEFSVIFDRFDEMLMRLRSLIDSTMRQEKALQLAEYRNLQAHIAPHFLYNSFNVMRHCIHLGEQEAAEKMATHLGSYFRYLSDVDAQEDIPLGKEYRHVVDYLAIQQIRFQDHVHFMIDPLPERYHELRIPPFTLQPLVENIFKHGINNVAYSGQVEIRVREEGGHLAFDIRDNGVGIDHERLQQLREAIRENRRSTEHTGIVHTCMRLKQYFKEQCLIAIDSEPQAFFRVHIEIPLEEDRNND